MCVLFAEKKKNTVFPSFCAPKSISIEVMYANWINNIRKISKFQIFEMNLIYGVPVHHRTSKNVRFSTKANPWWNENLRLSIRYLVSSNGFFMLFSTSSSMFAEKRILWCTRNKKPSTYLYIPNRKHISIHQFNSNNKRIPNIFRDKKLWIFY